jgi:hypothetical protein
MAVETYLPNQWGWVRSSDLTTGEVVQFYSAICFGMWRFGPTGCMNTHTTILWESLGVRDHQRALKLLGRYLNEARKWARVGTLGVPYRRPRGGPRSGQGFVFHYAWVCEHSRAHGFHSHILCSVPKTAIPAFRAWTRAALVRLAQHPGDRKTVRIIPSREQTEAGAVYRCWAWFRYLSKMLDPSPDNLWRPRDPHTGAYLPGARHLRDVLQVKRHRLGLPVTCWRLADHSTDLGSKAQKAAGFLPAVLWAPPELIKSELYSGWELKAWRERQELAELDRRLAPILPTLTQQVGGVFDPDDLRHGGKKWRP